MCHGFRHVFQRGLIYGSTGDVIKSQSRVHVVYIIKKVKKFQIIFFWYSQTVFFESDRRWHEREEEKKFLTDFKLKKKEYLYLSSTCTFCYIYSFLTLFNILAFFFCGYPAYASKSSVKSVSVILPFSSGFFLWNYNIRDINTINNNNNNNIPPNHVSQKNRITSRLNISHWSCCWNSINFSIVNFWSFPGPKKKVTRAELTPF